MMETTNNDTRVETSHEPKQNTRGNVKTHENTEVSAVSAAGCYAC